jgi:preprotein translocase subunit YajC
MDRKLVKGTAILLIVIAILLYFGLKDYQKQQKIIMKQVETLSPEDK